jgi:hypothetical protein
VVALIRLGRPAEASGSQVRGVRRGAIDGEHAVYVAGEAALDAVDWGYFVSLVVLRV